MRIGRNFVKIADILANVERINDKGGTSIAKTPAEFKAIYERRHGPTIPKDPNRVILNRLQDQGLSHGSKLVEGEIVGRT